MNLVILFHFTAAGQGRKEILLDEGWLFTKGDPASAEAVVYDDSGWESVTIPHDWAITGPFDKGNDLQVVAVTQNFETVPSEKTGRTGGLPYVGTGWYRTRLDLPGFDPVSQRAQLLFEGTMSEARVFVNGRQVGSWPNGYNAFHYDITPQLTGEGDIVAVRLENLPQSSRWYPGAGLYRNVKLIITDRTHIPVWGTYITTPEVESSGALVDIRTEVENPVYGIRAKTVIYGPDGKQAAIDITGEMDHNTCFRQRIKVDSPELWSPESPALYTAITELFDGEKCLDRYETVFGIRKIEYVYGEGFKFNGSVRKFKGVCNHHDLGPLGAAVNVEALRHQLTLLKDLGCDAIRTSHNMPARELVELCDRMGFMMMIEPFDEWDVAKCANGYHRHFSEWAERDMVNMIRHFRNNPSVVMWSIGNEVPTQTAPQGIEVATFLRDICHREDPTRPVTCGMDRVAEVIENGFAAIMDIPGFNYRTRLYGQAHEKLPGKLILGAETASTVSSRGIYKFPVEVKASERYEDHQSSSYDVEHCYWSNLPDDDFALADDHDWTIGQFVWTGFDYLGEPSPYDTDSWPSHSSLFGIIDLASLPKDRYYLYRSIWNTGSHTLHVLPHWTWPGREGEVTPVFIYTDYPEVELFVNGESQGRRKKDPSSYLDRYRLRWMDVVYRPGELKAVAYDESGNRVEEKSVVTAGPRAGFELLANKTVLAADGKDLAYVTVRAVDDQGNPCPADTAELLFEVTGAAAYRAAANGDPTCLYPFHENRMPLFSGELTVIVQSTGEKGDARLTVRCEGQSASLDFISE